MFLIDGLHPLPLDGGWKSFHVTDYLINVGQKILIDHLRLHPLRRLKHQLGWILSPIWWHSLAQVSPFGAYLLFGSEGNGNNNKKVMKMSKDIGVLIPLFSVTTCMTLDLCLRSVDGHT